MSTYESYKREQRRLVILRLLAEQSAYKSNSSVLRASVDRLGISSSRDDVRTDLAWLSEQGLLRLDEPAQGVYVAVLSERGMDVSQGNTHVPGVARPSPK
ncbi:MAG: ArsR family transcriptional regulator [Xanthomonadaceae bacterium]|nr:ArsR family transcriptional regulator [Xanthomonadaceae bacterium]MDP2185035.1 ArsR family transcriptional regulator [Xanthomonadales bacterium]MDZ4114414.1 ArsR family transcriptional regulator [Xanthomonadaceae bacterium]